MKKHRASKKLVSIIIPMYNEARDIPHCLRSLDKQSYKDIEIIAVDDGSEDGTRDIVRKFKNVRLVHGEHKGPGFSRNLGAKLSNGKILVFIDADMIFDRNYIQNLISPILKNEEVIGTTHDYEIATNTKNVWSRCWGKVRVSKKTAKDVTIFRAIRKNKFLELGGFDPEYGYADDQTLWFKYRIKPIVAEGTTCYHKNPETLKSVYMQSRWIGSSINKKVFGLDVSNSMAPFLMTVAAPLAIPILSIKKSIDVKIFRLFPWMIIFITTRYFGTVSGLYRKNYFGKNVR